MRPWKLTGSYGHVMIDSDTGHVLSIEFNEGDGSAEDEAENIESGYLDIERVDLAEYRMWLSDNNESLMFDDDGQVELDITHLGYWNKDGSYDEPAVDYREDCLANRREYRERK